MDGYDYVVNFEKDSISVYKFDDGIVLYEPMLAVCRQKSNHNILEAVGYEAEDMISKLPKGTRLVTPVRCGKILDFDVCSQLLDHMLCKVEERKFFKNRDLIFLIPCGLSKEDIDKYISLAYSVSAKNIRLICKGQALSLLNTTQHQVAKLMVVINSDYLDVAVVLNNKVLKGYTIAFEDDIVSNDIRKRLSDSYDVDVSDKTLCQIENDIATILPNDIIEKSYVGVENLSGGFVRFDINSSDFNQYYVKFVSEVADILDSIIKSLSKEIIAELNVSGLMLTGNMAGITGLENFLAKRLGLKVEVVDDYIVSILSGAGSIIGDTSIINTLSVN